MLLEGCRCLEIDIWNGEPNTPDSVSSVSSEDEDEDGDDEVKKKEKKERRSIKNRLSSLSGKLDKLKTRDGQATVDDTSGNPVQRRAEPRVFHGYTLTKEITFRDVCYAIRDGAFVNSDLPVVVSLEVHTNPEQQETMVEIMSEAWKGLLVDLTPEMIADLEQGKVEKLPSPLDLRNKILIKVKWTPPTQPTGSETPQSPEEGAVDIVGQSANEKDSAKQAKPSKVVHALSQLGVYTQAHTFRGFTHPGKSILICEELGLNRIRAAQRESH